VSAAPVDARRTAFVTGASQGLGQVIAVALAREGFDLVVSARSTGTLDTTLKAVQALGRRVVPVALDLREQAAIEGAMAAAVGAYGQIDVLVNNAGLALRRPALEVSRDEFEELIDVMLTGTFFMSQQMGRHLVAQKRPGCIVNLASTHGLVGLAERSTYGIAKGGIVQMTRMLAIEWAEYGIRVNSLAPGTVNTPSRAEYFRANPEAGQRMLMRVPLGRFATPDEVGAAVVYLVSPAAAYITGQTLVLDGGLTAA
jgi:NAD(P)-dependent dehydrogenase (short-subunit alcohol dehydrogenase family)